MIFSTPDRFWCWWVGGFVYHFQFRQFSCIALDLDSFHSIAGRSIQLMLQPSFPKKLWICWHQKWKFEHHDFPSVGRVFLVYGLWMLPYWTDLRCRYFLSSGCFWVSSIGTSLRKVHCCWNNKLLAISVVKSVAEGNIWRSAHESPAMSITRVFGPSFCNLLRRRLFSICCWGVLRWHSGQQKRFKLENQIVLVKRSDFEFLSNHKRTLISCVNQVWCPFLVLSFGLILARLKRLLSLRSVSDVRVELEIMMILFVWI